MGQEQRRRFIAATIYISVLALIQFCVVEPSWVPSKNHLWLLNGLASLIFGFFLTNPHYTSPAGAAANGFVASVSMLTALAVLPADDQSRIVIWVVLIFACVVLAASVLIGALPDHLSPFTGGAGSLVKRAVVSVGAPRVIFSIVMLATVWAVHRSEPLEVFFILGAWGAILGFNPVEKIWVFFGALLTERSSASSKVVGEIAAHQMPGIALVRVKWS